MTHQPQMAASQARHAGGPRGPEDPHQAAGIAANERLTTVTGALLLVLFAAEGVTILSVHRLLTLHFVFGMLLAGPLVLKIGSSGYRFARYYTGAPAYVRKGPPPTVLRLLGPVVVLTSCGVIGTGIMLAFTGPGRGLWLLAHKALFVLWFGAMAIHVIAHLPDLGRMFTARGRGRAAVTLAGSGRMRWLLLAASLSAGLALAVSTVHLAAAWQH